jgi:hypothetical protein
MKFFYALALLVVYSRCGPDGATGSQNQTKTRTVNGTSPDIRSIVRRGPWRTLSLPPFDVRPQGRWEKLF